ncbi:MAG: nitroreductase family protein [Coriobacteriia bacterium]|nr:nitroreductase family protein [Coriobacteriia bacterium]
MNETLKTIAERYTCRSFDGTAVAREDLEAIALAGAQAPTAANSQRFRLIVISDKAMIDGFDEAAAESMRAANPEAFEQRISTRGPSLFYNAPAMIVIAIEHSGPWSSELDCGIVVENMALAAQSLDVANCINLMAGTIFQGEAGAALKESLQFPEGFEFGVALLLGYPTDLGRPHAPATDKIIWV